MELRVLYLTMNPNRQSTTVPMACWFNNLRPKGLSPFLVSNAAGDFYRWALSKKIPTYKLNLPLPPNWDNITFLRALLRLYYLVKKFQIQLIHCNEHDIYPIAKYISNLTKKPLVVSVHSIMHAPFARWAFKNSFFLKRIYFVSNATLMNSRTGLIDVVHPFLFKVLPNCIETKRYEFNIELRKKFRQRIGITNDFVIGAACALQPIKQLEHIVKALIQVNDPSLKFVLAGGGKVGHEEYSANFLKFAKASLKDKFIYLGHLDNLQSFYSAIDIYISVSKEEAFPISVLEALACGRPVVAYPSKGSLSEIINSDVGMIVSQNQIAELAVAILTLKKNSLLRDAMGSQATYYVVKNYSASVVSNYLLNDYLALLK